jgi:hypothetical protein
LIATAVVSTPRVCLCPMADAKQPFLPGLAPVRKRRRDDSAVQAEQIVEEITRYADVIRPRHKRARPIDRSDLAHIRTDVVQTLRMMKLPIPDDLDGLLIELIGWWHEFPLAADVPPPQIERMPD